MDIVRPSFVPGSRAATLETHATPLRNLGVLPTVDDNTLHSCSIVTTEFISRFGLGIGLAAALSSRHRRKQILRRRHYGALSANSSSALVPADTKPAWRGGDPTQSTLPSLPDGSVDYGSIDVGILPKVMLNRLRFLIAKPIGHDDAEPGYNGLMELFRVLNQDMNFTADEVQKRTQNAFSVLFAYCGFGFIQPLVKNILVPIIPSWTVHCVIIFATLFLFRWLVGPMEPDGYIDLPVPTQLRGVFGFLPESVRVPQTMKVEQCRFLQTSQCASICVNSCKVPCQGWMKDSMGVDVHIQPNYDDFSCRWVFGKIPPPLMEDEAVMVPCFTKCTSRRKGENDAFSLRRREALLRKAEDERLAAAVAATQFSSPDLTELTPHGTASNCASLHERSNAVHRSGNCWKV